MKDKILSFLIEKTNNEVGYTSWKREDIREKLEIENKDKFAEEFRNLIKEGKIFFFQSKEEKINYDGSIFEITKFKYFTDKNKFMEYQKKYNEKSKKINETKKQLYNDNEQKLETLSENAKLIYKIYKEMIGELGYIDSKLIMESSELNFTDYIEGQKELTSNKLLYLTKISKENDEKFVLIERVDILTKVLKREEIKRDLKEQNEHTWNNKNIKNINKYKMKWGDIMKNFKIFGYEAKEKYENPISGKKTIEIDKELLFKIRDFNTKILEKDFNPKEIITNFRDLNKNNKFTFKCGGGYEIEDVDLLGGIGDGLTKRLFEAYIECTKDKTVRNIEKLENLIDEYNERYNSNLTKNYIIDSKKEIEEKNSNIWNSKNKEELER